MELNEHEELKKLREGEDADNFVRETIESCRLFTLPTEEQKYYTKDRRDQWDEDSDEIMLLLQFFQNCLASGDSEGVVLARRALDQFAEVDDDALQETVGFVLLTWLDGEELEALFDPDKQPWFRRYKLAVTAGYSFRATEDNGVPSLHPPIELPDSKRDRVFTVLKKHFKSFLKELDADSQELFNEALVIAEFRDNRAIPVLRRYALALRDCLRDGGNVYHGASADSDDSDDFKYSNDPRNSEVFSPASNLDMMIWEIKNLGGDISDLRA